MNERKVVVYLHVTFETYKFGVNQKPNISHVMSVADPNLNFTEYAS